MGNSPVPLRIAVASQVFTICWMLFETLHTGSTKNSGIGSAVPTIPKYSPSKL
jgi:hypothetical protein